MAATVNAFRPNLYSEWLLPQRPLIGCGISTICHANDMGSLGEFTVMPNGQLKGTRQRLKDLMTGYRAFKRVPDSNGIPDTDDYLRIHQAISDYPLPERMWTRSWDDVMDQLKARDVAVSIAVRLSVLGSRNTIDQTTADHQVLLWGIEPNGQTNAMGPMRAVSRTRGYHGHKALLSEVRKAARAIEGGLILTWLSPIGEWTEKALALEKQQDRIAALRKERNEAEATADVRRTRLVALRAEIVTLRENAPPGDCAPLVANARAAGWESAHAKSIEYHQQQRTEGP